jgi:hypothetical protein
MRTIDLILRDRAKDEKLILDAQRRLDGYNRELREIADHVASQITNTIVTSAEPARALKSV